MDTQIEKVQELLNRVVDAKAGFEVMVDKAEPEFRPVPLKFRETHHQHAQRISAIITAMGGDADDSGSLFATVNRTVVSLRSLVDEIDADVMHRVREGEDHVIEAFDDAINALNGSRHRDELMRCAAKYKPC